MKTKLTTDGTDNTDEEQSVFGLYLIGLLIREIRGSDASSWLLLIDLVPPTFFRH